MRSRRRARSAGNVCRLRGKTARVYAELDFNDGGHPTRVSDLYSHPHDQIREQLRLAVEKVKERQEGELINNADYGLLSQATSGYRISTRKGAPTPAQSQRSVRPANALCTRARLRPAFAGLSFVRRA